MESIQHDNETISLKNIIVNYLLHWKLIFSIGGCSVLIAFLYLFLTPKTYEMMTKVQLLEDKGTTGAGLNIGDASGLMKSFGLGGISGTGFSLDDERVKLSSTSLLKEVVLKLGMNVSYYKPYAYKYQMYEDIPLLLSADSETLENQEYTVDISVDIDKSGSVKVKTESEVSKNTFKFASLPAIIKTEEGTFVLSYRKGVVKPLSMDLSISPAIAVAEDLSESMVFEEFSKNSNVLEISCTDYEKKRGVDLLSTLVEFYNNQEDSVKKTESGKSIRFLDERLKVIEDELSRVEYKIEQYKLQNKMTSIESDVLFYAEQMKELQVKIIELEAQGHLIDLLDDYIKDPGNKYNLVPITLASGTGENTSNPVTTYNEALLERIKLMQSTKTENPLIGQINLQVDQLRESVFLSIENAKKSLALTLGDLKGKEKVLLDKMGVVPTLEREYVDFRRQQEIYQALYLILLQKKEDFIHSIGDSKERARVVEMAYVKQKKVAPRMLYAALFVFIFTLVIPAVYLFTKEQIFVLWNEYKRLSHSK
ncbi:Wzz/FepE/Etk N-terminal domain-containing protein [Parabacteroides sp. TM07-1AC]|jgi:uncharacterized protein involved in exopolysaccharide biosynthesis|uniref:GumC family protein n=1 Tax=Parabacteroides sp. TM07-1AC TaxID=2292363 RepID=UPI000F000178|nr:Wzz/FepE/Etk N-terminal domain-containing protein [Parabacteroides sp. TM07-1AC]RHU24797.1 tyrosine protein kinase [Parabacteroides sp. TM07-1AC]